MDTEHISDGFGDEPAYTAVGTYGEDAKPYVRTVYTWNGTEAAIGLARDACAYEHGPSIAEGPELRLIALFHGDPEPVDLERERYEREPITALAERLLRGSSGEYMVTQEHTGGGVMVCQVAPCDEEDGAYAWISESDRASSPFLVGVYVPGEEEHVSLESVGVHELLDAVYSALARAERRRKAAS